MRTQILKILFLMTAAIGVVPAHAALVISKGKTSNVSCSNGICDATAADAVLNVKDLTNMLAATDVSVFAEGVATDITVSSPFDWASSHKLTLGAFGSLSVQAAITVEGTSGLTMTANAADTGGIFQLAGAGKISFWDTNSTLVINGTTYTLIDNLPDLVAAAIANPAGTYAFANDYDATQDGQYKHSPIPATFTGNFEGLGNTLSNLTIYDPSGYGTIALFSQVGPTGQLSDINLANISIQSNAGPVALLAALNYGTVTHASATGAISALPTDLVYSAAGLIDDNEGTITKSHAVANLSGSFYGGGLVGTNNGTISLSYASGSVSAFSTGGLVETNNGTISDSNASGPVSGSGCAGGLVSVMIGGTISGAYATGNVTATSHESVTVGGLVGYLHAGTGLVQDSFATGAVSAAQTAPVRKHYPGQRVDQCTIAGVNVGGLVGYSSGTISSVYATGSVTGRALPQGNAISSVGGLVGEAIESSSTYQGYSTGRVILNAKEFLGGVMGRDYGGGQHGMLYWDIDTSNVDKSHGAGNIINDKGLKGLKDKKFLNGALLRLLGSAWAQSPSINNGYPYLIANPPPP